MRLGHVGRIVRPVLIKTIPVPSIVEKVLLAGWVVFAPTAIAIGIGQASTHPIPAFYWFGAAAASTVIAVFLWDEVLRLQGRWRIIVCLIAVLVVLFSVWQADNWVVRSVKETNSTLEAQEATESKALAEKTKPVILTKFILPLPAEQHKTKSIVTATAASVPQKGLLESSSPTRLSTPCTMKVGTYYPTPLDLPGGPELRRPIFQAEGAYEVAWSWYSDRYLILMEIALTNRGEESIVKNWELCLIDRGTAVHFQPGPLPDGGVTLSTGESVTKNNALIEETATNPIKHGQRLVGWVAFSVPRDLAIRFRDAASGPSGSITCEDYLSHEYSYDFVGLSANETPKEKVYVPGVN